MISVTSGELMVMRVVQYIRWNVTNTIGNMILK
jgi:hypothetical protein